MAATTMGGAATATAEAVTGQSFAPRAGRLGRRRRRHPAPVAGSAALLHGPAVGSSGRDALRLRLLVLADCMSLIAAYGFLRLVAPPATSPLADAPLLIAVPLWIVLNQALHLYARDANVINKSSLNELPAIFHSLSLGTALAFLFVPLIAGVDLHRDQIILWWLASLVMTPTLRAAARWHVRRTTGPERVAIVGSGYVASLVARKIGAHAEWGTTLVGYLDTAEASDHPMAGDAAHLGDLADFERLVRKHEIERVVIAFSSLDHEPLLDLIRMSKRLGLKISIVPRLFEVIGHAVEIDMVEGMTLMGLRGLGRTRSMLALKRAVDIIGAALALLVSSPLLLAVAVAVKLDSPGPVLFGQRRRGRGHSEFRMLKFRSMVDGADALKAGLSDLNEMVGGPMFKIANDPRATRVGRFIRRTSIDELPQLLNVLRGEMSLVGPRPLVPEEDDAVMGWHRARLDLTPGLTGPWQVMGRNAIPFEEMVKLDYLYVAEWSLWNDIKLLLRTLPVMVASRGL